MARQISSTDDVIDSRDVIARLEELQDERETLAESLAEAEEGAEAEAIQSAKDRLARWDEENGEELAGLRKLNEEGEDCSDWKYGATLIRESCFEEYCRQDVEELGYLPKDVPWWLVIDWKATTENLKADYTAIEWEGITFYVRS